MSADQGYDELRCSTVFGQLFAHMVTMLGSTVFLIFYRFKIRPNMVTKYICFCILLRIQKKIGASKFPSISKFCVGRCPTPNLKGFRFGSQRPTLKSKKPIRIQEESRPDTIHCKNSMTHPSLKGIAHKNNFTNKTPG